MAIAVLGLHNLDGGDGGVVHVDCICGLSGWCVGVMVCRIVSLGFLEFAR